MITLYELHWSHYCEKVRLALNYMQLPWRAVDVDPFTKSAINHMPAAPHLFTHTLPAIHDESTGAFVMDSTPILRYLSDQYIDAPSLFPGDEANRAAIEAKLVEFDSMLGLTGRRLAYTQLILEDSGFLAELFLAGRAGGFFRVPVIRHIAGAAMGMMLTQRFDFHRSESLGLYEALEKYLIGIAANMRGKADWCVVGGTFSAADITLAALLRPLTIVPFFAEHAGLRDLFAWQQRVATEHGEADLNSYQKAIQEARKRRAPMRRHLRAIEARIPFTEFGRLAQNDQKAVWTWRVVLAPFNYFFGLRANKLRQEFQNSAVR